MIVAVILFCFPTKAEKLLLYPEMVLDSDKTEIPWAESVFEHIKKNYRTNSEISTTDTTTDSILSPYVKNLNSWEDLVSFLGFVPWNPIEGESWATIGNYNGTNLTENGKLKHCRFDCNVLDVTSILSAYVQTGYYSGEVGIIMTSYYGSNDLVYNKTGSWIREIITINTSFESPANTYDCFFVTEKNNHRVSLEMVIGKDKKKVGSIKLETEKKPDELKKVYERIKSF